MARKLLTALVLAMICFIARPARAAHFSGAYLLQLCTVNAKGQEKIKGGAIACEAYIDGGPRLSFRPAIHWHCAQS